MGHVYRETRCNVMVLKMHDRLQDCLCCYQACFICRNRGTVRQCFSEEYSVKCFTDSEINLRDIRFTGLETSSLRLSRSIFQKKPADDFFPSD
jgi:hypothetical protein